MRDFGSPRWQEKDIFPYCVSPQTKINQEECSDPSDAARSFNGPSFSIELKVNAHKPAQDTAGLGSAALW